MARFLTLTSSGKIRRGRRKKTIRTKGIKVGPVALCFVTVVLVCLLSLFYLAQSNKISTKGYEIRELEEKLEALQEENHKLELKAAELQSVKYIEEEVKHLNMVPVEEVIYLTPGSSTVVLNR